MNSDLLYMQDDESNIDGEGDDLIDTVLDKAQRSVHLLAIESEEL